MTTARYLVVGSSYIGALFKASLLAQISDVEFAGSGGQDFRRMRCSPDGYLEGYLYASSGAARLDLHQYDHVFIYHDLPEPSCLAAALTSGNYSSSLAGAYIAEQLRACQAMRLAGQIAEYHEATNITLIPENLRLDVVPGLADDAAVLKTALSDRIPYNVGDFAHDIYYGAEPRDSYYKGSLYLNGELHNAEDFPDHDNYHFNAEGGRIVLQAMLAYANKLQAARAGVATA